MYTVGQISKAAQISVRTLHYYDELGLLKATKVSDAGYRMYSKDDLMKLHQIIALKKLGIKLSQIKEIQQEQQEIPQLERWKRTIASEIKKVQEIKKQLNDMEQSLNATLNMIELTGDFDPHEVFLFIQSVQQRNVEHFHNQYFSDEEQRIIKNNLPDMTSGDDTTKRWIELLREIKQSLNEPFDSPVSQRLAERIMQLSSAYFQGNDNLLEKYWNLLKPETDQDVKSYGLDRKTMTYIENIIDWYEKNRERGAKQT
jgi:DNA-binding transcriptional MerR regulator